MKISCFLALLSPALALAQSTPATLYTPIRGSCPSDFQLVRRADDGKLSFDESAYTEQRRTTVLPDAWRTYLANVQSAATVDLPDYVSDLLDSDDAPTMGIAMSGGGYRAALFGAGVLNALDGRNDSAAHVGTGGLLQAATYLTGLSGGSWLVGSLAQHDFPSITSLVSGWTTTVDLCEPEGGLEKNLGYWKELMEEVRGKHKAGFAVTIVDLWARSIARHFLSGDGDVLDPSQTHGAGMLWSDMVNVPSFINHQQPFPIILADSSPVKGAPGTILPGNEVPLESPIFEFSPYEMGSFDANIAAFTPTKYLGTSLSSSSTNSCVIGYDQTAYIQGTSSDVFNGYIDVSSQARMMTHMLASLTHEFSQPRVDLLTARYPNAFQSAPGKEEDLLLVDGGEDGEVIPLAPLLVKGREVDVVLAVDACADVNGYTAGSSLIATASRTAMFPGTYNTLPHVPSSMSEFTNGNLTRQPTFFGCNATDGPLVIYLANGERTAGQGTNTSTTQTTYNEDEVATFMGATWDLTTLGGHGGGEEEEDPEWPVCLACAVVERARVRTNAGERSGACESCLERYCWS